MLLPHRTPLPSSPPATTCLLSSKTRAASRWRVADSHASARAAPPFVAPARAARPPCTSNMVSAIEAARWAAAAAAGRRNHWQQHAAPVVVPVAQHSPQAPFRRSCCGRLAQRRAWRIAKRSQCRRRSHQRRCTRLASLTLAMSILKATTASPRPRTRQHRRACSLSGCQRRCGSATAPAATRTLAPEGARATNLSSLRCRGVHDDDTRTCVDDGLMTPQRRLRRQSRFANDS